MNQYHFDAAVTFGRALLTTGDLDPVYIALEPLKEAERFRTVLAYSCLYHLGAAGYLAESTGSRFWDGLEAAAKNENRDWPRGSERRHWRGKAAVACAGWLRANYEKPEQVIYSWYNGAHSNRFEHVAEQIKRTPAFGPWVSFKLADIMERCLDLPVDFSDCNLGFYKKPRAGAALLATGDAASRIDGATLTGVVEALLKGLGPRLKAPPDRKRNIGIAEAETILCKYKSHCNGHYPLGKDTREVAEALHGWGKYADRMAEPLAALRRKHWNL
jgi:hypothetical protein